MAMSITNTTWMQVQDSVLPRRERARDLISKLRSLPITTTEGGDLSPTNNTPDDHGTTEDFATSLVLMLAEILFVLLDTPMLVRRDTMDIQCLHTAESYIGISIDLILSCFRQVLRSLSS